MGNTLGSKRTTKIVKINGETLKLKTPVQAGDVVKDYPGHVLLESETVKHFGIRAKPLETWHELKPKRLYFLVELPKADVDQDKVPRRASSGIHMSAKDRLESMMLARRSTSDLSIIKSNSALKNEPREGGFDHNKGVRLKVRIPKAEVARVMMESKDEAEAAEKIMAFYRETNCGIGNGVMSSANQQLHWKNGHGRVGKDVCFNTREKRVSFMPIMEPEIQLAVAS